ncbi:unnamed protein product [Mucor hiemalis]
MSDSIAKVYAYANTNKPKEYYDYEALQVTWGSKDVYEISCKIGRGKYSEVFAGVNALNQEKCVIKSRRRRLREIEILQNLTGGPNIIGLLDVVRDPESALFDL